METGTVDERLEKTFKIMLRDINTAKYRLLGLYKAGVMPIMKMNPIFAVDIDSGEKTTEFRKSEKFNQTGWVAVVDMETLKFLYFMFITPRWLNPYIGKVIKDYRKKNKEFEYFAMYDSKNEIISEQVYDFLIFNYDLKHDFIMFDVNKVVR